MTMALLIMCDQGNHLVLINFNSKNHLKIKDLHCFGVNTIADDCVQSVKQFKDKRDICFEYRHIDSCFISKIENTFQFCVPFLHKSRYKFIDLQVNEIKNIKQVCVLSGKDQAKPSASQPNLSLESTTTNALAKHPLIRGSWKDNKIVCSQLKLDSKYTYRGIKVLRNYCRNRFNSFLFIREAHYLLSLLSIIEEIFYGLGIASILSETSLELSVNHAQANVLQTITAYSSLEWPEKEVVKEAVIFERHVQTKEGTLSYSYLFKDFLSHHLGDAFDDRNIDWDFGITYKTRMHNKPIYDWPQNQTTCTELETTKEDITCLLPVKRLQRKDSLCCIKSSNHINHFSSCSLQINDEKSYSELDKEPDTKSQSNVKGCSCDFMGERLKLKCHWIFKYNWSERLHFISYMSLQVCPVFNTRLSLHSLMRHELFRVCSFAYSNPPVPENVQVTQLAQSGFYNLDDSGRVCCFFCGHECDVTNEESVEIAYRHHCRQQEQNIPLNEWTLGLNPTDQHPYFSLYGDRTPTLFALPDTGFEEGDDNQLEQITGATGFSEGVNTGDTRQTLSYSNSQGANDAVEGSVNPSHHSLPTNLNTVSGSIVIQESEDSQSSQVLTSKSLEPVNFSHTPTPAVTVAEPSNTQAAEQSGGDAPVEGAIGGQATFDLGLASYPQFASSASRRATYTGWNPDHPQRPDDLVAGGFFYAGYADCVRCFNCGLGLKYWRPNDIPAYQHARFRPNCVYNKMYKGQEYIDKVQQDLREEQAAALALANANNQDNQVATPYTLPEATQPPQPQAVPNVTPPSTDIEDHEYLRLPASQGALAAGWRREQVVQAVTNVVEEMGVVAQNVQLDILMDVLRELYSADQAPALTGSNNRNEVIISSSSVAEPSIASIRRPLPDITLPDSSKVAEYRLREDAVEQSDSGPAAAEVADAATTVGNPQEQYRAVERENAYLNQRTICGICHERPVNSIYLPCGHVLACQICAENESYCRACNRPIVATSNIYLS